MRKPVWLTAIACCDVIIRTRIYVPFPEPRHSVVKTSFGHIPIIEQRDVFITVI
jgi:hypothetical protein